MASLLISEFRIMSVEEVIMTQTKYIITGVIPL